MRWHSGCSVHSAVGRPGVLIPLLSHSKRLKKNGIQSFPVGAQHLGEVVKNKLASSLVVSLGKALDRTVPPFMLKTGGPDTLKIATRKRVPTPCPKYSNTIGFLQKEG